MWSVSSSGVLLNRNGAPLAHVHLNMTEFQMRRIRCGQPCNARAHIDQSQTIDRLSGSPSITTSFCACEAALLKNSKNTIAIGRMN